MNNLHHFFSTPLMLDLAPGDPFYQRLATQEKQQLSAEEVFTKQQGSFDEQTLLDRLGNVSSHVVPKGAEIEAIAFPHLNTGNDIDGNYPFPVIDGEAFLSLSGVLGKRLPWWSRYFGMTDLDVFQSYLKIIKESDEIKRVRCIGHTPGGSVIGILETMRQIRGLGKPTVFQSDTFFASAGYFIASAFDRIEVTPTCHVGSIGVIMGFYDWSGFVQGERKIKPIVIRSGPNKSPGHLMGESITKSQIDRFQEHVDSLYTTFDTELSAYRPGINEELKDGRVITGEQAFYGGLADEIVSEIVRPEENDRDF
jgi:ATP-dependent protease ClpP protease subunit